MDQPSLEARVATLETRAARLRVLALLAVGLAVVTPGWFLLASPSDISEGRLWIARDTAGTARAMFGLTADGVGLTMYDSTGQMRLDVGLAPGGVPGVLLLSARGEPVASLNLRRSGRPVLRLTDFLERERLEIEPAGTVSPPGPTPPDTMIARQPRP